MSWPVDFKESNFVWKGWPEAEGREKVLDLPAYRGEGQTISYWGLSWIERVRVLLSGRVWLHVIGEVHPPVYINTEKPFTRV